ncbi:hypothetical protein WOLCODRAFT_88752 [Wolfiporia cocos MD-104 SS10]|uniref:Auxin efflux carrier n=1 Tax=Wolfiporia cocos (strain MD-104) TaxID=742152 RepID=A0A2H3JEE5_WOLCO|nr:hypothetical protein WOLCODRAFT_88752 [Wolfiporia cocos MD-104 SS10]
MSGYSTVLKTFLGALQGTISVLFTCLGGYVVTKRGLLDRRTVKHISKLCTSLFLPCLLIVQIGPELTVSSLSRYWIIPLCWLGQHVLGIKHWTIIACGRPNSNALPLLLLQSLETTGVLEQLSGSGESMKQAMNRAKSLLLLNAIVQQVFTFQLAPSVDPAQMNILRPGPGRILPIVQDEEHVGLLDNYDGAADSANADGDMRGALDAIVDTPDVHWPAAIAVLAPLVGAIIAFIFGMTPPLHQAFLDEDGAMYASITQSVENLGSILGWYVVDPLVWFLLVLLPAGPSAMLLVNVAEIVDIDQGPIAGYLTVAYLLSPLMAIVCSIGLSIVHGRS